MFYFSPEFTASISTQDSIRGHNSCVGEDLKGNNRLLSVPQIAHLLRMEDFVLKKHASRICKVVGCDLEIAQGIFTIAIKLVYTDQRGLLGENG